MSKIKYCDICQSAFVELNREIEAHDFYMCTMCRDNKEFDGEKYPIPENTFENSEAIDYGNN